MSGASILRSLEGHLPHGPRGRDQSGPGHSHVLKPLGKEPLEEAIDLSTLALAEYRRIFLLPWETPLYADRPALEKGIRGCLLGSCNLASRDALRFKVRPFFDFSAWNLVIGDSKTIYLLDFPKADYVSTPHRDLGRLKFSLELIKQYLPLSKFLGWDALEVPSLYSRFLEAYCSEVGFNLNEEDHRLIDCFTRANIKRSQDTHQKLDQRRLKLDVLVLQDIRGLESLPGPGVTS